LVEVSVTQKGITVPELSCPEPPPPQTDEEEVAKEQEQYIGNEKLTNRE